MHPTSSHAISVCMEPLASTTSCLCLSCFPLERHTLWCQSLKLHKQGIRDMDEHVAPRVGHLARCASGSPLHLLRQLATSLASFLLRWVAVARRLGSLHDPCAGNFSLPIDGNVGGRVCEVHVAGRCGATLRLLSETYWGRTKEKRHHMDLHDEERGAGADNDGARDGTRRRTRRVLGAVDGRRRRH